MPRSVSNALLGKDDYVGASLPMPSVPSRKKKLSEVADLDNVLAYKGNYMVFALKENNYLTLHMMQDYLEVGDELRIRDPDELGRLHRRRPPRAGDVRRPQEIPRRSKRRQATTSSSC